MWHDAKPLIAHWQGGWEAPAAAEPAAPFADGDGWDTGSQLPGGSVHLGLAHEGEGLAALAAEVPRAAGDCAGVNTSLNIVDPRMHLASVTSGKLVVCDVVPQQCPACNAGAERRLLPAAAPAHVPGSLAPHHQPLLWHGAHTGASICAEFAEFVQVCLLFMSSHVTVDDDVVGACVRVHVSVVLLLVTSGRVHSLSRCCADRGRACGDGRRASDSPPTA